jgi:hypothetical protein
VKNDVLDNTMLRFVVVADEVAARSEPQDCRASRSCSDRSGRVSLYTSSLCYESKPVKSIENSSHHYSASCDTKFEAFPTNYYLLDLKIEGDSSPPC